MLQLKKNICQGKMNQATAFASWDKCLKYIAAAGGLSGEMGRRERERLIILALHHLFCFCVWLSAELPWHNYRKYDIMLRHMSIAKLTDVRIFSSQREQIDKNGKSYITLVLIFCVPFFLGHDRGAMEE